MNWDIHGLAVRITPLAALLSVALATSCAGEPSQARPAGDEAALDPSAAQAELLAAQAQVYVAQLAGEPNPALYEAHQALTRMGRAAVPALLEGLKADHEDPTKQTICGLLGDLGLAAQAAIPQLKDLSILGPGRVASAAAMAVGRIQEAASCGLPDLPPDTEVHVVGQYQGKKELDVQLGESGHVVTQIEVVVGATARPCVLVLTAYDPVVWNVGVTPKANLAGVLVSGYHTQALLGIPASVPHKVTSGEQSMGCESFHASGAEDVAGIEKPVSVYTGHRIHEFHGATPYEYFQVGGGPATKLANARYSQDLSLEDYPVYRGDIPAGVRGLDELERRGKIRRATREDVDAWLAGAGESATVAHTNVDGMVVVLEEITLPPGLFGAHSRTFIIPEGVSEPQGPRAHCQFWHMKDFTRR